MHIMRLNKKSYACTPSSLCFYAPQKVYKFCVITTSSVTCVDVLDVIDMSCSISYKKKTT